MLKFVGGVYYIMLLYVLECVFSKKKSFGVSIIFMVFES